MTVETNAAIFEVLDRNLTVVLADFAFDGVPGNYIVGIKVMGDESAIQFFGRFRS